MKLFIIMMLTTQLAHANKSPFSLNRLLILSGQKKLLLKNKNNESGESNKTNQFDKTYSFLKPNSRILFYQFNDFPKIIELSRQGHEVNFVHSDLNVRQKVTNLAVEFGEEVNVFSELTGKNYDALFLTKKLGANNMAFVVNRLKENGVLHYKALVEKGNASAFQPQEMLKSLNSFKVIKYEESHASSSDYALFIGIK